MRHVIDETSTLPVAQALLGAIDVDGGATEEQRQVLQALVCGWLGRDDLELTTLASLDPHAVAAAITDEGQRRRLRELLVLLEMCRHPLSEAQVERVDAYAAALAQSGPGLELARTLVRSGAEAATADYFRFLGGEMTHLVEPSLADRYSADLPAPDLELAERLRALHDLPPGTLGHEYVEFYRRNGIDLPGDDPSFPAVFVSHDMCHVIGGYEPSGQGEVALGAMQIMVADNEVHWLQFLGNLAVHEAGYFVKEGLVAKEGALARPGATDMLAEALVRGERCTGDFTAADHLAMADWPLADVRAAFGVPPLSIPQY
jgi:hypothetical protein